MAISTNFYDPGATNVQIPAATSQLHVEFSRNVSSFALNRYMQIIPGQRMIGLYAELSSSDPVTIVTQEENLWTDGSDRPVGRKRPLRWREWVAERRAYDFTLGTLTVDQATFDIVAAHARGEAARAMTDRTIDAATVLTTSANWPSTNTSATVDALTGGSNETWVGAVATVADQFIKKGFNKVKQNIAQQTGGVVRGEQLCLVISPIGADGMARSPEVREYMVNHEQAMAVLQGADRRFVDTWGLPPILYGIEICVEDAVRQTTIREIDGSGTLGYVLGDNAGIFVSRVGALVGSGVPDQANAAPSFTTLTGFFHEEMSVETETDGWNRLIKGGVTDTRDIVLTAPNSGYLVEDITT